MSPDEVKSDGNDDDSKMERKQEFKSKDLMSDDEILAMGVSQSNVNAFKEQKFREAFTLEKWINNVNLKKYTFDTAFISITKDEAKALLTYFRFIQSKMSRSKSKMSNQMNEYYNDPNVDDFVNNVKRKIDDKLGTLNWNNGFFAKFNSRSPKDVYNYDGENEYLVKEYYSELDKMVIKRKNENDFDETVGVTETDALLTWYITTAKLLKMNSGNDVITTFSKSFRSMEDLSAATRMGLEYTDICIAIRKWNDDVPYNSFGEFRCFVHNKQLNAITQYLSMIKFKELQGKEEVIKRKILNFFDIIKDDIKQESFVIDFLLINIDKPKNDINVTSFDDIFIIELNPFYVKAGAGLFNWKNDRNLFLNGPCQIRIRNDIDTKGLEYLHPTWQRTFKRYQKMRFRIEWNDPRNNDRNNQNNNEKTSSCKCVIL